MVESGIIPQMHGGSKLLDEFKDDFGTVGDDGSSNDVRVIPRSAVGLQTHAAFSGTAALAEGNRPKASYLDSLIAGAKLTDTASMFRTFVDPEHPDDPNYNSGANFKALPFAPNKDEFDFLQKSNSQADWDARLARVSDIREWAKIAGDNPLTSTAPMLLDPIYIGMDALTLGGAKALRLGRVGAAIGAAAGGAGVSLAAGQSRPQSINEVFSMALMNGAVTAGLFRAGKLAPRDPDFPGEALTAAAQAIKPKVTLAEAQARGTKEYVDELVPEQRVQREVAPGKFVTDIIPATTRRMEKVKPKVTPEEAAASRQPIEPEQAEALVEDVEKTWAQRAGEKLQWNMRKQMASYGKVGEEIADLLFDNNSNLAKTSVESHHRSIRAGLTTHQRIFEDILKEELKQRGAGLIKRIQSPRKATAIQAEVEEQVLNEMRRREQYSRKGIAVPDIDLAPRIKAMADALDKATAASAKELTAAGVRGGEDLTSLSGWFSRRWSVSRIEEAMEKFKRAGMSAERADMAAKKLLALSLRLENGWDKVLSYDIAAAIINRTIRKGYFEDAAFNAHQGTGTLNTMRDILKEEGLSGQRLQRALDVLAGKNAESGKAGFLKHRLDMDYSAATFVDGQMVRVTDMMDQGIVTNFERYLDGVASQAAWARSGVKDANELEKLKSKLMHDIKDPVKRAEAEKLWTDSTGFLRGEPAGEAMNTHVRTMAMWGRSIALANSGLWQVMEYSNIMAKYGMVKTLKVAMKEMPILRRVWGDMAKDKLVSTQLKHMLSRQSEQDMRLRPYLHRFEDNFEMAVGSEMQLRLQQTEQLVPYVNAMRYIHHHQAVVSANLITDRLAQAAKGNTQAREMLAKYGIDSGVMDKLSREVSLHGMDTAKWSEEVWAGVRPTFSKMMDEAVLHARLGDMPAFARFDNVGKFLFTYRSFMLTAHNKALAGGLARDGSAGVALLMMYQFPLAMLAVRAQEVIQGREEASTEDLAWKAVGMMGGLGIFSELVGVASGQKGAFGSPGTIPIDRVYAAASQAFSGDAGGTAEAIGAMAPVLALTPLIHQLQNKE